MTPVASLLARLDLLGVTIEVEHGNLRVRNLPPDKCHDLLDEIRQHKAAIIAALQTEAEYVAEERRCIQAADGGR